MLQLRPEKNCWRTSSAARFSWLIDGENYFRALRDSIEQAEREIIIIGWDIDSRTELIRDEDDPRHPSPLCETLKAAISDKPELNVYILSWDFAAVYMLERELLPAMAFGWTTSERMHFKLDSEHVSGASHHQKIVIVDASVAFVGGFDLTKCRWDTREHAPDDDRRTGTDGDAYRPFHDIQALVSGPVVKDLRELATDRWRRAGCDPIEQLELDRASAVWPGSVNETLTDASVAVARTFVDSNSGERIQEVEQLFIDMIASAESSIYIENQYFTSASITEALEEQLRDEDGPEIVMLLPGVTSGWLEQATMDLLRHRAVSKLREADSHNKLRILAPHYDALADSSINVHAKIMIVDNRWIRIGSANLSRRSMGLDSECDLLADARGSDAAIMFCADLLSEHMDTPIDEIQKSLQRDGLLATIDTHNGGAKRLKNLETSENEYEALLMPLADIADMEKPILNPAGANREEPSQSSDSRAQQSDGESAQHDNDSVSTPTAGWVFLAVIALAMGAAIYFFAIKDGSGFEPDNLLSLIRGYTDHALAPFVVAAAIVAGSLVIAPITGMIAVCALVFDPWIASATALSGTILATALNHWIGKRFGNILTNRVPDKVASRIERLGKSSDVFSLAALRLIPIAPFTVINLVVGAAGISLRSMLAGTLIGMGPGILVICLSVDRARAALSGEAVFDPKIIAAIAIAATAFIALRVWLNGRGNKG